MTGISPSLKAAKPSFHASAWRGGWGRGGNARKMRAAHEGVRGEVSLRYYFAMPCAITYQRTGKTLAIETGGRLLDAFRHHNVPVHYSCEDATCGTCIVRIVSGMNSLSSMGERERALLAASGYLEEGCEGYRLACQARIERPGALTVAHKYSG